MATTAPAQYRLISADSHVNEPPDLWVSRVSSTMRDRAPRIERFDAGDAWVIEGVDDPINFGMNACAGLDPEAMEAWVAGRCRNGATLDVSADGRIVREGGR